ncbi:glycosyltransferase family 39 protein [Sinosporangium album]|nr:glycosyltransferase family 39 protein [Sinosporangium album]
MVAAGSGVLGWCAGVAAFAVVFAGSWVPSMWADELATAEAVSSPAELAEVLAERDVVFVPYYALMLVWSWLGGADWWLRLPSALGIGAAAGLLADLGRRLGGVRAGVAAALVLVVLPSMSRFGQEARPYALAVAAAVLSFWALHRVLERPSRGRWAGYGVAVALLPCTHLFAVLVLPAHLVVAAVAKAGVWRPLLGWMAAGCVPAAVLAVVSASQVGQVSWLAVPGWSDLVLLRSSITSWRPVPEVGHLAAVLLGWAVVAVAVAGGWALWRSGPGGLGRGFAAGALVWGALPALVLFAVSQVATPVYNTRYALAAAPGFALLAGVALARVRVPVAVVAVGAAVAVAWPQHVRVREPGGHEVDYRSAAAWVSAGRQAGDAVVFAVPWAREGLSRYGDLPEVLGAEPAAGRVWLVREETGRAVRPGTDLPSRYGLAPVGAAKVTRLLEEGFAVRRQRDWRGVTVLLLERAAGH